MGFTLADALKELGDAGDVTLQPWGMSMMGDTDLWKCTLAMEDEWSRVEIEETGKTPIAAAMAVREKLRRLTQGPAPA